MAKTELTKAAEQFLWNEYIRSKMGIYGCYEVNLGKRDPWEKDREVVDFITYKNDGTFRCYEIKVSVSDFKSNAKTSFLGHYNYYVMTTDLFEKVKLLIPRGIGVVLFDVYSEKRNPIKAKRQKVSEEACNKYMAAMMKSIHREQAKFYKVKGYWE